MTVSDQPKLIFLRISGLYNPDFDKFKSKIESATASRVVAEPLMAKRRFDSTLASLAVDAAALLVASIALFFHLRDRRTQASDQQLIGEAVELAQQRLEQDMPNADLELLHGTLEVTEGSGIIEHEGIRISFHCVESIIEFEADLGEPRSEPNAE